LNLLLCRYVVGTASDVSDLAMRTPHGTLGGFAFKLGGQSLSAVKKKQKKKHFLCQHLNLGIIMIFIFVINATTLCDSKDNYVIYKGLGSATVT